MKETFVEQKFSAHSMAMIGAINQILAKYEGEGYDLSLRQLYYQLVTANVIENSERSYKRTGALVSNARLAGLIDWHMIADRGRVTVGQSHWENPGQIVEATARSFSIDKWKDQPYYCEVMVEKQALEGVLIPVCRDLSIHFTANKGYSSSSAMYYAGMRLEVQKLRHKKVVLFYLGDHDDRLKLFAHGEELIVRRLALNYPQIEQMHPPRNPAKDTDARYGAYVERYGTSSWELDAIEPRALASLVTNAVLAIRDRKLWALAVDRENAMRAELRKFADQWKKK
jgi:hypothetical protein